MSKRTICLDFDGVVHSYTSKWQGADVIPDPPVEGTAKAVRELRERGYEVVIFSTRCATQEGVTAVRKWLLDHEIEVDKVCQTKPPALVYVDDRAIRFYGQWGATVQDILAAIMYGTWQGKGTASET